MKGMTKRQREILFFIETYIEEHQSSPSYREIAEHFSIQSVSSVHKHIKALKRKGMLTLEEHCARSLYPIEQKEDSPPPRAESVPEGLMEIPFVGTLSKGQLIETFFEPKAAKLPSFCVQDASLSYLLQLKDDSFASESLFQNDFIVVEAREEAEPGELVIALINKQEAIVRKYYPEGTYVRLEKAKSEEALLAHYEDVTIKGVVISLFRLFDT
ncbi:MAG: lexA [Chlamydiales bacterium]|jgi:repressor LexA|nr:lexA [Chlamydiales bacterium]